MDTHDRKVIDVLGDQKRFIVPFYQRHYKWGERLWISFWEDVVASAFAPITSAPHPEADIRAAATHFCF